MANLTTNHKAPLRIGTRGSPLALAQAAMTRDTLIAIDPKLAAPGAIEIVAITTTGDRIRDRALSDIGGKGLFVKEIEEALLNGGIDIAVHSMKDMPPDMPAGLTIAALLPREDARDVLIAKSAAAIADFHEGAILGTASLRRQAQILARRPDMRVIPLRGNVETRIAKIERGEADFTLLALAGLKRLGKESAAKAILSIDEMLPAAGQGAIGIEARENDESCLELLSQISHAPTAIALIAERAAVAELEGSCRAPIGAYATIEGDKVHLRALLATPDGRNVSRAEGRALLSQAAALGQAIGQQLKKDLKI